MGKDDSNHSSKRRHDVTADQEHRRKKRHKERDEEGSSRRKEKKERKEKKASGSTRIVDDDVNGDDMWVEKNIDLEGEIVSTISWFECEMLLNHCSTVASCYRYSYSRVIEAQVKSY